MIDALVALKFVILAGYVKLAKQHRHDPWWCVVAQALRKVKGVTDAKVYKTYTVVWFANGRVIRYRTPSVLAEALTYWDRMGDWKVKPGTYYLEVPPPSQTIKAQKRYGRKAKARVIAGNYTYVYGPRGPQKKKKQTSARHFFGCIRRNRAA